MSSETRFTATRRMVERMVEEPEDENPGAQRTFSAREIVEEFFPATPARLVPGSKRLRLHRTTTGNLKILDTEGRELLVLEVLSQVGDAAQRLCCELCQHTAGRPELAFHRAPVPGSNGRRWRYLTSCRDAVACESRRHDDNRLQRLLAS